MGILREGRPAAVHPGRRWRPLAVDVLAAVVVAVLQVGGAVSLPGVRPLDYALLLTGTAAVAAWRRAPAVAVVVASACMLLFGLRTHPGPPAAFPVLITVFGAVRAGHRLLPAVAGTVFLAGTLAGNLLTNAPVRQIGDPTSLLIGWFLAAGVGGTVARHRSAYLEQAQQRAAEAERTREEAALRRAGEERLRIARELHDSLTHSISIIKVQAGVAVHLARKRGEKVPEALLAIQEAGGEAMRELRATLEVLRDDAGEPPGTGLDRLDDLVSRARSAGLPVTVRVEGRPRPLPAAVDRAAYRIVQEALTNVARHATGHTRASVRVGYGASELSVLVDDDGRLPAGARPVPGVGLTGMRERITALGGRLHAGPGLRGGFTVRAELPLPDVGDVPAELPAADAGDVPATLPLTDPDDVLTEVPPANVDVKEVP
ncbi:sensor histidine kinase [Sphaerisporangium dianthi]|uniref:histidine kinase n=1 Tax=Sphaerisporangium dianthi TaxID=1436120 RepID=A0ABV9CJV9_9ACTN